jgi:TrmH family RNA methyltransferase
MFAESNTWRDIRTAIRERQLTANAIPDTQAAQLSDTQHPQGVFAIIKLPPMFGGSERGVMQLPLLMLDDIADPGNLGTLLRTADWFAVPSVWISQRSADVFNPKVLRSGMGAHFHLPFLAQDDPAMVAEQVTNEDICLIGAAMDGKPLDQLRPQDRNWALVIGSEAHGLSAFWRDKLNEAVAIPGHGGAESLNAAVAAGIILYYLCGQHTRI